MFKCRIEETLNGKKRKNRIRDLEIWSLGAVPWICWSYLLPCLQGLRRAVNQAVFAQLVRLSPQAHGDVCFQEPTNERFFLFVRVLQVQTRRKEKVSRCPQKKSAISKLS